MLDLSVGGTSWKGFTLKKYSNCKEHRLFLPASQTHYLVPQKHFLVLSAQDIQQNWAKAQEYQALLNQIHDLKKLCDGRAAQENHELKIAFNKLVDERDNTASHFTENESRLILEVLGILSREVLSPRRRARPVTAVSNTDKKMSYR